MYSSMHSIHNFVSVKKNLRAMLRQAVEKRTHSDTSCADVMWKRIQNSGPVVRGIRHTSKRPVFSNSESSVCFLSDLSNQYEQNETTTQGNATQIKYKSVLLLSL